MAIYLSLLFIIAHYCYCTNCSHGVYTFNCIPVHFAELEHFQMNSTFRSCIHITLCKTGTRNVPSYLKMANCPVCNRHVLPHAKQIRWCICLLVYYIKCLSLKLEDQTKYLQHADTWYCMLCLQEMFPFNCIEDDAVFISEIHATDLSTTTIESLDLCMFNPFMLNDDDFYTPLWEIDPDINFYNKIDSHLVSSCNYYMDSSFLSAVSKNIDLLQQKDIFSMCHINIRSLKANLGSFETCLANLNFEFTVIGVSETWLRDDNCDLYHLDGYHFTEVHRTCRSGGGVGIYVKNSIPFLNRRDLKVEDEISESVFIEIDKQIFNRSRNIMIGVIYRPPGGNLQNCMESMNIVLNGLRNENKLCFLMGEFNINLLNYEKNKNMKILQLLLT